MAAKVPLIALRSIEGISLCEGKPPCASHGKFERDTSQRCRVMDYSPDGSLFAWCNGECVTIVNTSLGQVIQKIPKSKTACLSFSPQGTFLSTWEPYSTSKDNSGVTKNLTIWAVKTGNMVAAFSQKRQDTWKPRWTDDEKVCARSVNNEVHCFHDANFSSTASKLRLQGVGSFEISSGAAPYTVAAYVPGTKGAPSYVRLYRHPDFDSPGSVLANKSFFKADSVEIKWNRKGTAALVMTFTEVDKSGASYYGEQTLHCLNINGESSMVQLAKRGPIYDISWSPNAREFCVVYGLTSDMPAKATLYDIKCDALFDFGTGPRNEVHYNRHGNNYMHYWVWKPPRLDGILESKRLEDDMQATDFHLLFHHHPSFPACSASDTTYFEWSPDGQHILTATTAPRLREGNGFKIWHYTGSLLFKTDVRDLWQAKWQPFPDGVFSEDPVSYKAVPSLDGEETTPKPAYIPPHLRATGASATLKIHEDEPPQNLKQSQENMSKSASKNKKKREAKARAKQEQEVSQPSSEANPTDSVPPPQPTRNDASDDSEKKLRNLRKKLRQIEELKGQQKAGKTLESNQLEKLSLEATILKEIRELES